MIAHDRVCSSSSQTTEVERGEYLDGDQCSSHTAGHVQRCWTSLLHHAVSVHPAVI